MKGHDPDWDANLEARGPVGLLISAILWHGLKIDKDFKVWQDKEEAVDILQTPYQSLQPQLMQMAARPRAKAVCGLTVPYKNPPGGG